MSEAGTAGTQFKMTDTDGTKVQLALWLDPYGARLWLVWSRQIDIQMNQLQRWCCFV